MTAVERFHAVMSFRPVDRLPAIEWAPWWSLTLQRWRREGLPQELDPAIDIARWFGLDPLPRIRIRPYRPSCPQPTIDGAPLLAKASLDEYRRFRQNLYTEPGFDEPTYRRLIERRNRHGDIIIWLAIDGFFWFPRSLLGVEPHLLALYEDGELVHAINLDLANYHHQVLNRLLEIGQPDLLTISEDLSYNHGPMLGRAHFEEFLAPYYALVLPQLCGCRTKVFLDSDGNIDMVVPWMLGVGFVGLLPLERRAGVDVARLRRQYPNLLMIGGFDKTVMKHGRQAMVREFHRLGSTIASGGFIPSVDHQTPPDVSLENYRSYVDLLKSNVNRGP